MPEGHTIARIALDHTTLLKGLPVRVTSPQGRFAAGAELLDGRVLTKISPYGKHLWYQFEGDVLLHVHLGLYGKWTVGAGPAPEPRGMLRVRMVADDHYLDLRGPTACEIHTTADRAAVLARLGPDPLSKDDGARAWERIHRSKTPIGQLLMDQKVLAGIGNVYRAEVLFRAGQSPFTPGRLVLPEVWDSMWQDTRTLMRSGVRANRIVTTEPADRARRSGVARREDAHYVYRRNGLPCRRCGTEIRTEVMAGRNLFWCPTDQA